MTLHFYDVGQALAVLVELPDGRRVLVDAGDEAQREGCGPACARAQAHLLGQLKRDLGGAALDLLWITHQHSDHIGGAPEVLAQVPVAAFVDNGRDARKGEVRRAHEAALSRGTFVHVVDPEHPGRPLPWMSGAGADVTSLLADGAGGASVNLRLTPIVPPAWPRACREDENECSIALRIDYCKSSVLFTGDAEHEEEGQLDPGGPVTLLQVGHHGSDTSTSLALLARTRPAYAVISAGKPAEGLNRDYCHPRALVVRRLSRALRENGDARADRPPSPSADTTVPLSAFDGTRCDRATSSADATDDAWVSVPASSHLWATERDGDVVLTTTGDGVFRRLPSP
jgi:competence protein ComEC